MVFILFNYTWFEEKNNLKMNVGKPHTKHTAREAPTKKSSFSDEWLWKKLRQDLSFNWEEVTENTRLPPREDELAP